MTTGDKLTGYRFSDSINEVLEFYDIDYSIYEQYNEYTKGVSYYAECEYYTDSNGYDFLFIVECGSNNENLDQGFEKGLAEASASFDVEDEMMPFIQQRGKNGIPKSIREILKDGEECDSMLKGLSIKVELAREGKKWRDEEIDEDNN